MENQTVTITLERYEELIKKEFILDKLMEYDKEVALYLYPKGQGVGER